MGQNIKPLAAGVCVFLCVRTGFWGRISRKRLETETWYQWQWTTSSKWPRGNRLVTWSMTLRFLERSRSWPQNVWGPLSRKRLEIQPRLQQSTYRKCHPEMAYEIDEWRHLVITYEYSRESITHGNVAVLLNKEALRVSESCNLRQTAKLNSIQSHISCQN